MHPIGPRRSRGYIVLLFLSSLLVCLPEVLGQRLPVRIYTTADGLWSSAISYLMCDSHGFIWLCTRDGLSRFDGYRFVNYKIGQRLGVP
jgi:ligand-binding sensor domain-containing protein